MEYAQIIGTGKKMTFQKNHFRAFDFDDRGLAGSFYMNWKMAVSCGP